jgi:pimeloyl-ACP methyl ester carboxylesterase
MLLHHTIVNKAQTDRWVVFLHGAGGSIRTWKWQLEPYSRHYKLLLLDLRDHGDSQDMQPPLERYTLDGITNDILRVLDARGIHKAHFVTLSMGSFLMQHLMLRRPELVDRCIMAGAVILGNWRIRCFTKAALLFNRFLSYRHMYTTFSWLLMPRAAQAESRRIYQKQAEKISPEAYLRWVGLYDEFMSTLRRFSDWHITAPTLLAMGENDYVFLSSAQTLAQGQQAVSLAVIPSSGHICNIDNSDAFNRLSLAFLTNGAFVNVW